MDNLAKVAAIESQPGLIIPCIKLNRGIWVASRAYSAPFQVHLNLVLTTGGARKRLEIDVAVSATQPSTDMPSDATSIYVDTPPISVRELGQPDPGSSVIAIASVVIADPTSGRVQASPPDYESYPVAR